MKTSLTRRGFLKLTSALGALAVVPKVYNASEDSPESLIMSFDVPEKAEETTTPDRNVIPVWVNGVFVPNIEYGEIGWYAQMPIDFFSHGITESPRIQEVNVSFSSYKGMPSQSITNIKSNEPLIIAMGEKHWEWDTQSYVSIITISSNTYNYDVNEFAHAYSRVETRFHASGLGDDKSILSMTLSDWKKKIKNNTWMEVGNA